MRPRPSRQRDLFEVDQKMSDILNMRKPLLVSLIERTSPVRPSSTSGPRNAAAGAAKIVVDDGDIAPAELPRPIGKSILTALAFQIVGDLCLVADRVCRDRIPFFVHVDEFQTFSSDAFASLFSEARKFALHFCLANQFVEQLSSTVRAAVIGNAGTLIAFRLGSTDAQLLAPEFQPLDPSALADQEPFTA